MGSSGAGNRVITYNGKDEDFDQPVGDANREGPEVDESEHEEGHSQLDSSAGNMGNRVNKTASESTNQQVLIEIGTSLVVGAIALAVSWYTAKMLDPSRSSNPKKSKEKKRMIKERLGKKIETNQYVQEKVDQRWCEDFDGSLRFAVNQV